jgi:SAM-dependent methyltransferase
MSANSMKGPYTGSGTAGEPVHNQGVPDEAEAERIIGLYQRYAFEWDKERNRSLFEKPWLNRFLALLSPGASILDVGCGSAEPIARYWIERGYEVTGIDSSSALVGICKERFPNSDWRVADMRELTLGRQFDGVLAWDSFFHLSPQDQQKMFPVFRRHAAARGALMFTSGPAHGSKMGTYKGEPLYHGSLDGTEYRALLDQNGFAIVSNVVEDPACGYRTIWLAQLR